MSKVFAKLWKFELRQSQMSDFYDPSSFFVRGPFLQSKKDLRSQVRTDCISEVSFYDLLRARA